MLVQLRRERGLSSERRLPAAAGRAQPADPAVRPDASASASSRIYVGVGALFAFGATDGHARQLARSARRRAVLLHAAAAAGAARSSAAGGRRSSARNSPTRSTSSCAACAPAIRCRSRSPWWRARCPIRSAREFGIVADEITYGADLETGDAQSLFPHRPGRPAAVRHRGGDPELDRRQSRRNPGKSLRGDPPALQDAAQDPRARGRRPRLGADPVVAADRRCSWSIQVITPEFYASVWHEDITKIALAAAGGWMVIGNFIMYRMVNFRI